MGEGGEGLLHLVLNSFLKHEDQEGKQGAKKGGIKEVAVIERGMDERG